MLGHSRPKTTQIYTRVAGVEVKKTHTRHPSPREGQSRRRPSAHHRNEGTLAIDLAEKYRRHLLTLNYSHGTIKTHTLPFAAFIAWLPSRISAAVAKETIRDYQTHLFEEINAKGRPNSVASQNGELKAVKSFFRSSRAGLPRRRSRKGPRLCEGTERLPRSILTPSGDEKAPPCPRYKPPLSVIGTEPSLRSSTLQASGGKSSQPAPCRDVDYLMGFCGSTRAKAKKTGWCPWVGSPAVM